MYVPPPPSLFYSVNIFQVADNVQQVCSAEAYPCLHLVIPALEQMHRRWTKLINDEQFSEFKEPIQAALDSIRDYYDRTSSCDAYTWAMGASLITCSKFT